MPQRVRGLTKGALSAPVWPLSCGASSSSSYIVCIQSSSSPCPPHLVSVRFWPLSPSFTHRTPAVRLHEDSATQRFWWPPGWRVRVRISSGPGYLLENDFWGKTSHQHEAVLFYFIKLINHERLPVWILAALISNFVTSLRLEGD